MSLGDGVEGCFSRFVSFSQQSASAPLREMKSPHYGHNPRWFIAVFMGLVPGSPGQIFWLCLSPVLSSTPCVYYINVIMIYAPAPVPTPTPTPGFWLRFRLLSWPTSAVASCC